MYYAHQDSLLWAASLPLQQSSGSEEWVCILGYTTNLRLHQRHCCCSWRCCCCNPGSCLIRICFCDYFLGASKLTLPPEAATELGPTMMRQFSSRYQITSIYQSWRAMTVSRIAVCRYTMKQRNLRRSVGFRSELFPLIWSKEIRIFLSVL